MGWVSHPMPLIRPAAQTPDSWLLLLLSQSRIAHGLLSPTPHPVHNSSPHPPSDPPSTQRPLTTLFAVTVTGISAITVKVSPAQRGQQRAVSQKDPL
jgi:hypothetical protein